jgi:hypothetical protein
MSARSAVISVKVELLKTAVEELADALHQKFLSGVGAGGQGPLGPDADRN